MATLKTHKGVKAIYRDTLGLGLRYAICNDGKVLRRGAVAGWELSRHTPEKIAAAATAGKLERDTSPAATATTTRANADSHYHEHAKAMRRLTRRF